LSLPFDVAIPFTHGQGNQERSFVGKAPVYSRCCSTSGLGHGTQGNAGFAVDAKQGKGDVQYPVFQFCVWSSGQGRASSFFLRR